jgi:hypothetical protein
MRGMVGDPGIEPGVGRPGGVTVRCRTLQLVAHRAMPVSITRPQIRAGGRGVNRKNLHNAMPSARPDNQPVKPQTINILRPRFRIVG